MKLISVGTKSVLFGVHCFWWHWVTVALAWRFYHGAWPRCAAEWLAILCHDLGYCGCPEIDGDCGQTHPARSASFVWNLGFIPYRVREEAVKLILGHSGHYARRWEIPLSDLYGPDKLSVLFDPNWFYLLRARASGEVWEFIENSPVKDEWSAKIFGDAPEVWLSWYQAKVMNDFDLNV